MNGVRFRPVRKAEVALAAQQFLDAFGVSPTEHDAVEARFRDVLDAGELWGVDAGGSLLGHCRLPTVEHYFGGRPVRSMDVAGVAVDAKHRRQGLATALMEAAAGWGAHQGVPLSLLFPAVPSLYRRLGWEMAGTFPRYILGTPPSVPRAESMRQATDDDWAAIASCYDTYASRLNGPGRRTARRWEQLREGSAQYVLDGGDGIEAYVLLYGSAEPSEAAGGPESVDWAATTGRGMRAVVAQLASIDPKSLLHGPAPDSWSTWLDTWAVPEGGGLFWMARPLVLPAAIAARGFPTGVSGAVTFAVDDRLLAEARGPWRLEVAGGRGIVEPSSHADVLMDVRAVGPMFTGLRTPRELALAGLLDGPPDALAQLAAMFAATLPVALDFF